MNAVNVTFYPFFTSEECAFSKKKSCQITISKFRRKYKEHVFDSDCSVFD